MSTSMTDAVSRPDSIKHPPFPSYKAVASSDWIFATMFFATVMPSPSAKTPAFGTAIFSVATKALWKILG